MGDGHEGVQLHQTGQLDLVKPVRVRVRVTVRVMETVRLGLVET